MYTKINIKCKKCNFDFKKEVLIADTNMDTNEGSYSSDIAECPACGKVFDLEANNRGGMVLVSIDGSPINVGNISAPYDMPEDYIYPDEKSWQDEVDWFSSIERREFYSYFMKSCENIESMLVLDLGDKIKNIVLCRMLLVQTIASMEAYLSDAFIHAVTSDADSLKKLFTFDKQLSKERYTGLELINDENLPKNKAHTYLSNLVFHNLEKARFLYGKILGVSFNFASENQKGELHKAINMRHDCVHRNGVEKNSGQVINIDSSYLQSILSITKSLVGDIESQLKKFHCEELFDDSDIPF